MNNRNNKDRNLKKIFQWNEYLNWSKLTDKQKINFKRACLFPLFAYIVYRFLVEFTYALLIIYIIYFFIRFINRNKISK